MRNLVEGRSIVIKPETKRSCFIVWNRQDYLAETKKKLSDMKTYEEATFSEHDLSD